MSHTGRITKNINVDSDAAGNKCERKIEFKQIKFLSDIWQRGDDQPAAARTEDISNVTK